MNRPPFSQLIDKNNFDFCRWWLAIMVLFSHSFVVANGNEQREPLGMLTSGQLNAGNLAVRCFFAISGFLVTNSWMRSKSTRNFLFKRVLRIYPGFVVAVLFGLFLIAPLAARHFELTSQALLSLPLNLALLRRVEPSGVFAMNPYPETINGSLWSIPYEFKCYLGVVLLGRIDFFTRRKYALLALLAITILAGTIYPTVTLPSLEGGAFAAIVGRASEWLLLLPYFLAGTVVYVFFERIPFSNSIAVCASAAFALAAMAPPVGKLVFPLAITYLLFWFVFHPRISFYKWSAAGDFSYGIYLYAFPIQQLIAMYVPGISPLALFASATPLAIVAGALSWHLLEKHFLILKPKIPDFMSRESLLANHS